jgi:hypothetical protein
LVFEATMLPSGGRPVAAVLGRAAPAPARPPSLLLGGAARRPPAPRPPAAGKGDAAPTAPAPPAAPGAAPPKAATAAAAKRRAAPGQKAPPPSSSWTAKDARASGGGGAGGAGGGGDDYLRAIGTQSYTNTNVTTGQNVAMIDSLFAGSTLGHQTDIADGSLRKYEARSFANLVGDYYVSPSFMDRVASHVAKNYLADSGALGNAGKRVPLILGIWGPKGSGKTFQTELALKKLKANPIIMSAGELESDKAGEPGRLLRERYRRASELSRVRGVLSALVINDLDAGIGILKDTQRTVNNQMVGGTLMSICDSPNRVAIYGESWDGEEATACRRVPIIVTGNDFSTLFAPLIRDGRMEKFYWDPSRDDRVAIVSALYKDDGLGAADAGRLVDAFSRQSLDFFGAIRAATYDGQIREWIRDLAGGRMGGDDGGNADFSKVQAALLKRQGLPVFEPVTARLDDLLKEGRRLVAEQEHVNRNRLSEEYLKTLGAEAKAKRDGTWRTAANGVGLQG